MTRRTLTVALATWLLCAPPAAAQSWPDATPTDWHRLARAESLLSAPEPPNPVAVCVVDSGVNITPDLEGVVVERLAYDGGDPGDTYPQDSIDDGHGTYVATFLAGQVNGWGAAGTWPRAKIVSVRVFPPGGERTTAWDYVRGLRMCAQIPGLRVINLSLGDIDGSQSDFREIEHKVAELRFQRDINVVAAAGNRGGAVESPASYPGTFAVGAAGSDGAICAVSARGEGLDLLAPGCDLEGSDQHGAPATFRGTSFAAPIVSATLTALRAHAGLSAAAVEELIVRTARQVPGGLLLDAGAALEAAGLRFGPTPPTSERPMREPDSLALQPDFRDLPKPRGRARRKGRRITLRIVNRPRGASVEIRIGRQTVERRSSLIRLVRRKSAGSLLVRFLNDSGVSLWVRLYVR